MRFSCDAARASVARRQTEFNHFIEERGNDWMNLIDARNEMSHTYDFKRFEAVIKQTNEKRLPCFGELYGKLAKADIDANDR